MDVLDEAIVKWWAASGRLAASCPLWNGIVPALDEGGPRMPYCTFDVPGVIPDDSMSQRVENAHLSFTVRSGEQSPKEIGQLFRLLTRRFDDAKIPVAGRASIRCDRSGGGRVRDPDGGWIATVLYQWKVQEN